MYITYINTLKETLRPNHLLTEIDSDMVKIISCSL